MKVDRSCHLKDESGGEFGLTLKDCHQMQVKQAESTQTLKSSRMLVKITKISVHSYTITIAHTSTCMILCYLKFMSNFAVFLATRTNMFLINF